MNCYTPSNHGLRIRSLNCNRRYEVLVSLLNNSDPKLFDILCIQEPPPTFARFPSLCPYNWDRITPLPSGGDVIKCFIYVSKRIPSCSYSPIALPHANISAIRILIHNLPISLFNIYNPPDTTQTIETLSAHLQGQFATSDAEDAIILIGDFNKHDPLWAGPLHPTRSARSTADPLLDLIVRHGLELCLEPGTPTYLSSAHQTWSTLDLLLVSGDSLLPLLNYCRTFDGDASDHLGLEAEFKICPDHLTPAAKPRFREVDWEEFSKRVSRHFETNPLPSQVDTPANLDLLVDKLEAGISNTLKALVPVSKSSMYRNRWWTPQLTALRQTYRRLQRKIHKTDTSHASWKAMREARNRYTAEITRQKRAHWKQFLDQLTQAQLWTAARYTDDAPKSNTRVPALQGPEGMVSDTKGKSTILFNTFFPDALASYHPPDQAEEPECTILFEPFTQADIDKAIVRLAPFKAPGPSGIPNMAIKAARPFLGPVLLRILEASLALGHFPTRWRRYNTVTLRKPGKGDYTVPKAYRPVALEDTLGKVLESVIAVRVAALAEEYDLLPAHQFGGRPGRTTSDAILFITQKIKDAWRTGRIASVLLMDISQAFPTVPHPSLFAKLKSSGIPAVLVTWIQSFLTDRTTTLSFDDHVSPPQPVPLGIPQGSPLSPILYLLFNADLLRIPAHRSDPSSGFIDDTAKVVVSNTVTDNIIKLNTFLCAADQWSITHGSRFDYDKFQLVHFWGRKTPPDEVNFDLQFRSHTIRPSSSAKYLGVILDDKLSFKFHAEQALARGTRTLGALSRLKIPHGYMRQLVLAMVFPRVEYALLAWYEPVHEGLKRRVGSIGLTRTMAKLQRRAAKLITGALTTTATDMADYHAYLLPVQLRLQLATFKAAVRLCTLPPSHPLQPLVQRCRRGVRRHRSAIHKLMDTFPELQGPVETIRPVTNQDLAITYLKVHPAQSREAAKEAAEAAVQSGSLCIFSDGSGYKGGIGAAAVAIGGRPRVPYEEYTRCKTCEVEGRGTYGPSAQPGSISTFPSSFSSLSSLSLFLSQNTCTPSSSLDLLHSRPSLLPPSPSLPFSKQSGGFARPLQRPSLSPDVRRFYLGTTQEHTVFEAEVCGALLGLDLIRATPRATRATLFIDCQPAISAIKTPKAQSGQYLLDTFRTELQRLQKQRQNLQLEIYWVPGHEDIEANEWVDVEAKTAAQGPEANQPGRLRRLTRPLPPSAAALIASQTTRASKQWKATWAQSKSAKKLRPADLNPPVRGVRALYKDRNRGECAALTQLRTGHAPLNAHLHRIGRAESPLCARCGVLETPAHFLIVCRRFVEQRRTLRTALRNRPLTLRTLVGPKARLGPVLRFIKDSCRFPHLFPQEEPLPTDAKPLDSDN